ncbi:Serine/threonine-protein kinase PknD [compost metagenome]
MRHRLRPLWPVLVTLVLIGCQHSGGPGVDPVGTRPDASPTPQASGSPDRDVQSPTPSPTPVAAEAYRIEAFFGNGTGGSSGDGGPAVDARLYKPSSVVAGPDGRIYVSDFGLYMVRGADPANGIAFHVYGTNEPRDASESIKAVEAPVAQPEGLAFDSKGRLFVAQYGFPGGIPGKVRMVDALGNTYTFAGGGTEPVADGAYALDVELSNPTGIVFDDQNNLYVAEYGAHRILRIDPDRKITVVAGTGVSGTAGDGGAATQAQLNGPHRMAFDPQGRLVFADEGNHRIRRIEKDGKLVTIAGSGVMGFSGDGGPAVAADLSGPGAIAYDLAGNLIITDSNNNCVRRVTPDGIIQTIAGQGGPIYGDSGDGGPALEAMMDYPYGLHVDAQGNIYVADRGNRRVRILKPVS